MIYLDDSEVVVAMSVGLMRANNAQSKRLHDKTDKPSDALVSAHVMGAQGELAISKALGVHWRVTLDGFGDSPDLVTPHGVGIEVKTVSKATHGLQIDENKDKQMQLHVLVWRETDHIYHPIGWTFGDRAWLNRQEKKAFRRPSFYVCPQSCLNPMDTIQRQL